MKTLLLVAILIHFTVCGVLSQVVVVPTIPTTGYTYYSDTATGQTGFVYTQPHGVTGYGSSTNYVLDTGTGKSYWQFNNGGTTIIVPTTSDEDD